MVPLYPHSSRRDRGFTLLEVMIVLAMILMLVSLLLPAVQQAREAARRTQCRSNLFQVSLALQNYRMAHGVLPPGSSNATRPILSIASEDQYHMGWIVQILPFLEKTTLFAHIDFSKSVYAKVNDDVRMRRLPVLMCPSGAVGSETCYFGVHNDFEAPIDIYQNGVLFLNSSIRREQVADGDSNTIFILESRPDSSLGWASGSRSSMRNGVSWVNQAAAGTPGVDPIFANHLRGNPTEAVRRELGQFNQGVEFVGGPGSSHLNGYHVAFGDGVARLINSGIDASLLRNLTHRSDGEMLGEF